MSWDANGSPTEDDMAKASWKRHWKCEVEGCDGEASVSYPTDPPAGVPHAPVYTPPPLKDVNCPQCGPDTVVKMKLVFDGLVS